MFPWVYGFTWDSGNVIFLSIFFSVVIIIFTTLGTAGIRALRDMKARQVDDLRWHDDFSELGPDAKICRHVLTGEISGRRCPNGFDCRICDLHPTLVAEKAASGGATHANDDGCLKIFGINIPTDRMYHRGHTWVKRESDGSVIIGLDEFGKRIIGKPDRIELPNIGDELEANGTGWFIEKNGTRVRILSPVDGKVINKKEHESDYCIRLMPDGKPDLRHLLRGEEIRPWMMREMERLEDALSTGKVGLSLADGGELVNDLPAQYPDLDWDSTFGQIFLDP